MRRFIPGLQELALAITFGCAFSVTVRFVGSLASPTEAVPDLDSFSEPAVAAAILKREAADLVRAYASSTAEGPPKRSALKRILEPGGAPDGSVASRPENPECVVELQVPPKSAAEWIARFREAIRQREEAVAWSELEDQVLLICQENNLGNEFIDAYLQMLARRPDSGLAAVWARVALDYSARCHRTEEVRDAIEHVVRFHGNRQFAALLKTALQRWAEVNQRSLIAGGS